MKSLKVYVTVIAEFSTEGVLLPKSFIWEDGNEYTIDRVKDKRRAASTKAGGVGERYTCMVGGNLESFCLQRMEGVCVRMLFGENLCEYVKN